MSDFIIKLLSLVLVAVVIVGVLFIICLENVHRWNDGCCDCGGHFKFYQLDHSGRYSKSNYTYQCDECSKFETFNYQMDN